MKNEIQTPTCSKKRFFSLAFTVSLLCVIMIAGCTTPTLVVEEDRLCLADFRQKMACHLVDGEVVALGIENENFVLKSLDTPIPTDTARFDGYPKWIRGNPAQMTFKLDLKNRRVIVKDAAKRKTVVLPVEPGQSVLFAGRNIAPQLQQGPGGKPGTGSASNKTSGVGRPMLDVLTLSCEEPAILSMPNETMKIAKYDGTVVDQINAIMLEGYDGSTNHNFGKWEAGYAYLDVNSGPGIGTMVVEDGTVFNPQYLLLLSLYLTHFKEAANIFPVSPRMTQVTDPPFFDEEIEQFRDKLDPNWIQVCEIDLSTVSFWVDCDNRLIVKGDGLPAFTLDLQNCRIGLRVEEEDPNNAIKRLGIYYHQVECGRHQTKMIKDPNFDCGLRSAPPASPS